MTAKLLLLAWLIVFSTAGAAIGQTPNFFQLGQREYQAGHFAESESYFRAALQEPGIDDATRVAILSNLGTLLLDEERSDEAEEAYTKALAIQKKTADKRTTTLLMRHLGAAYSIQRRDDEAISQLKRALKIAKSPPTYPELTAAVVNSLGVAYFRQARFKKAEQFFTQALQILTDAGSPFEVQMAPLLNNLGAIYCVRRNFPLAEQFLTKALTVASAYFGPDHPSLADSLDGLGVVYRKTGRYAEAAAQYQKAIAILREHRSIPFDVRIARATKGLADTFVQEGRLSEAATAMEEAVRIARANLTRSPEMIAILEAYSRLLADTGKTHEAKDLHAEAHRARITMANTARALKPE